MKIKLLCMDVDGTLTDGSLYLGPNGEEFKRFHVKDGLGIQLLHASGVKTAIITGRSSGAVQRRAQELEIGLVMQGIRDKAAAVRQACSELGVRPEETAFIGDDVNDLPGFGQCGLTFAPGDAVAAVREKADVCLNAFGGCGAVRECAEWLLGYNQKGTEECRNAE